MADYSSQIATARNMIQEKGMAMVYVIETSGGKDPNTGYPLPAQRIETDIYGLKTKPTTQEITAGLYAADAVIVLVAGDMVDDPSTVGTLEFSGHSWSIEAIASVAPAEQTILYKMSVKDAGTLD